MAGLTEVDLDCFVAVVTLLSLIAPALKQLLAQSARLHSRTVISGFISGDLDTLLQASVSCGSAVELLGKA